MNDRDLLPSWVNDGTPVPGAREADLIAAETHLGVALPDSYKDLLRLRDGGASNYGAYRVGDCRIPLSGFFNLANVVQAFDVADHFGTPRGIIAIASGDDEWLGLDYRGGGDPSVVWQQDDEDILPVATSFDAFLAGLVENG